MRKLILLACLSMSFCPVANTADLDSAKALYDDGWTTDAFAIYQQLEKTDPKNPELMAALARYYLNAEDLDKAKSYCKKAIKYDKKNSDYHFLLGNIYAVKVMTGSKFSALFKAGGIKDEYEKAVELDPGNVQARFSLVQYLMQAPGVAGGDKDEAWRQAEKIFDYDSKYGHFAISLLYEIKVQNLEKAREHLTAAIEVDTTDAEPLYWLASYFQRRGRPDSAVDACRRVTDIDPGNAEAYYQLGFLYQSAKKYDSAFSAFEKVMEIDSSRLDALYQVGRTAIFAESGLEKGEESFRKYLNSRIKPIWPDKASAHWRLAMIYNLQDDRDSAIAELNRALEINPDHEESKKLLEELGK